MATAQEKLIHLCEVVAQFYCELSGGDENVPEIQRVRQIQNTLKELADQNAESDDKRLAY